MFFNLDEFRVRILENFGFPREYVLMSVQENEANYCLAGYYLLGIDQNYWKTKNGFDQSDEEKYYAIITNYIN